MVRSGRYCLKGCSGSVAIVLDIVSNSRDREREGGREGGREGEGESVTGYSSPAYSFLILLQTKTKQGFAPISH